MGLISCEFECDYCKKRYVGGKIMTMALEEDGRIVSPPFIPILLGGSWLSSIGDDGLVIVCSEKCALMSSAEEGREAEIDRRKISDL